MALDKKRFIKNFIDETRENLAVVDADAIILEKNPEEKPAVDRSLRALHTIKGSARMLGYARIEKAAHSLENIYKGLKDERYPFDSSLMQLILLGTEALRRGVDSVADEGADEVEIDLLLDLCQRAADHEPFRGKLNQLRRLLRNESKTKEGSRRSDGSAEAEEGGSGYDSIRVDLKDVGEIVASLNNVIISQFQLKKFQERLSLLQEHAQQEPSSVRKDKGGFKKELQSFRKDFSEQIALVEQNSYKLQEKVMSLSMLPIDLVLGELPRMVAETSAILQKDIDLNIQGSGILLDKVILEKLNDPLIHLLRNAVDHGIETPAERKLAKKETRGRIDVICTAESGNLTIRIKDDGKGIRREEILQRAIELELLTAEDAPDLTDSEVFNLMFQPGFSSRETVSDLSGRGVGLDIVKVNAEAVKGKVTVQSVPGEGTEFLLAVPLSLATVAGFFILAGGEKFLIPSNFVHKIVRIQPDDVVEYLHKEAFHLEQQIIPLYSLSSLLRKKSERRTPEIYVVVVESLGERIGIMVDNVLQHVSLIYKPVPRNARHMKAVQGIVFDENYRIINILYIPELMRRFRRVKSIDLISQQLEEHQQAPVVLVVDDSQNTRDIEQSIFELEGYNVKTACDGIEALEILKVSRADLVVTDIQMPRMDGLTMVENIRKNADFGDVPILVVTGDDDAATERKIKSSGADGHIIKSDFNRNSLISMAQSLLQKQGAAP